MANTIDWGKATQNNTNGFGKYQNNIDAGVIYADSYSGETTLVGTSAAFSYSKSSYHQDEADPTPTITGTAGGTFSATPSGLSINTSTGTIDLDNSTIQSYTITYTVSGVSANFSLSVTASPFVANTYSMDFDSASSQYVNAGDSDAFSFGNGTSDSAFSVSAWAYIDNISNFIILTKGVYPTTGEWHIRMTSGNQMHLVLYDGTAYEACIINETLSTGQWYHFAFTYDGRGGTSANDGIIGYLNGSAATLNRVDGGVYGAMTNSTAPLYIAKNGSNYSDGKIDEVAIWNAVLSADAVQEIYNATNNNTGKVLDLNTDSGNYTSANASALVYWNRMGD